MRVLLLLLTSLILLTACGQKGPLYLPEAAKTPTNFSDTAL